MQYEKNTIIRLFDRAGPVLGKLRLPATVLLVNLKALRALGAVHAEVLA